MKFTREEDELSCQVVRIEADHLMIAMPGSGSADTGQRRLDKVTGSVVISATDYRTWPVASVQDLNRGLLEPLLEPLPEVLLLGTGRQLVFPAGELLAWVQGRGCGLEVMGTVAACRTYNLMIMDRRRVVAALLW